MNTDYKDGWPLPDEYLIELGRLSSLWAALESCLNLFIGKLAGFDNLTDTTPFILVTHSSFPQRLDMLGSLCEELKCDHPCLANHKEVISKLRAAQTNRNRFAHNSISLGIDNKTYVLSQGSARGKVKFSVTPITVDDIHAVSKEIHEANLALYKLVLKKDVPPIWSKNK
ncbi:hypothetical protein [Aeromonas veronii]|uniref:hypothetical protein n=1 Tax=Aeromonas veronii TaxID=654 RepID=UPI003F79444D